MLIKLAVAPVPHASELLRFSLKTGEIKQTLSLKSEIQGLSVLGGRVLAVTHAGGLDIYTPTLKLASRYRPYPPYLEGVAVSKTH